MVGGVRQKWTGYSGRVGGEGWGQEWGLGSFYGLVVLPSFLYLVSAATRLILCTRDFFFVSFLFSSHRLLLRGHCCTTTWRSAVHTFTADIWGTHMRGKASRSGYTVHVNGLPINCICTMRKQVHLCILLHLCHEFFGLITRTFKNKPSPAITSKITGAFIVIVAKKAGGGFERSAG
ncbi:hypothetical protein DFJ77DRAFT_262881 [Powellomyces hirtus]|nr:hypothetical protein DFJ77DRAFT_262881 [Powellomyces hirtus]